MREASTRATRFRRLTCAVAGLVVMLLALNACQAPDPFAANSGHTSALSTAVLTSKVPSGWKTFTDPGSDGFTISYPASWTFVPGYNAAHSSFGNSATATVFSPLVSTVSQSPADVIAKNTPTSADQTQWHLTVKQTQVAGYPAIDVFAPFIPTTFQAPNSAVPQSANRTIVMAVKNSAGTTNVYTFMVSFAVDKAGNMSAASIADGQTVDEMLATFTLPPTIGPVLQG